MTESRTTYRIALSSHELTILRAALDTGVLAWRADADKLMGTRWDDVRGLNSRIVEQLRHQADVAESLLERLPE